MNYPYPLKAILIYEDSYFDGGTRQFRVENYEEIGLKYIFQDYRLQSTSQGKFYTGYPGLSGSQEIITSFIEIASDRPY